MKSNDKEAEESQVNEEYEENEENENETWLEQSNEESIFKSKA